MRRLVFTAFCALVLPGCPLTDDYYVDGNVASTDPVVEPHCNDGLVNGGEACDGADLGGQSCRSLGLGNGVLTCNSDCRFDVSGCASVCGDGIAQGLEACDGQDLRAQTCEGLGLGGGTLGCTPTCDFNAGDCLPPASAVVTCGDGLAQGAEGCDGADLRGQTCATLGLVSGSLVCTDACLFDLAGCVTTTATCGDGAADYTEACDGADVGSETCETLGLGPGTLACSSACQFDTSGCGSAPGCGGSTGVACCEPKAELCDGISNDCDDEIDEAGVCPEDGTARTHDGHIYLLYLHPSGEDPGGGGWGPGAWNQGYGSQEDYGQATTTCRAAGAVLGLGVEFELARIESAEENEFARGWIAEVAPEPGMIWMGANDLALEGRWVWGQGDAAVHFLTASQRGGNTIVMDRYNDFTDGRPNSANFVNEDCGAFDSDFDWHWNDLDCGVPRLGFLCEQLD